MIDLHPERIHLKRFGHNKPMDERWDDIYGFLKSSRVGTFIQWQGDKDSQSSKSRRSGYGFWPCNSNRCGKLKERLNSHQLEYHPSKSTLLIEFSTPKPKDVSSVQTELEAIALRSSSNISIQTSNQAVAVKKKKNKSRSNLVSIPLRSIATQKLISRTNFYKQHLEDEIIKWFLNMPASTQNPKRDFLRFKVITNLIEKLTVLSAYVDTEGYHNEVIHEIEYCVDVLLMWDPSDKLQKQYLKKHLSRLLLDSVEALNEKWLRHPDLTWNIVTNCDLINFPIDEANNIEILRDEIAKWINENLMIASGLESSLHKKFLTDVFANRLIPILISRKNKKRIVKTEIKNILEEFGPMIKLPHNGTIHKVQLNKLATDLTDKLRYIVGTDFTHNEKVCNDQIDGQNNDLIHSVYNEQCKLVEEDLSIELVNILKLTDAPQDTISEITEVLFDSMDLVAEGRDKKVVDSIQKLLQKSGELSETEALSLANTLIDNVKASFIKDFGRNRKSNSTLVLLTSEQEIVHPFLATQPLTSTPLLPEQKKEVEKLNDEERLYIDKVAKIVEAWLDTIEKPLDSNEDQFFKQTIAKDIAGDVKDLVKFSQMQENMDKSSYESTLCYIIIKAIQKYELFNGPVNATTPQVKELNERIMNLGTPELLVPQHGNRQDLANVRAQIKNPEHDLRPDALNIVEDNISVWMNEQPSEIFKDKDRFLRNDQLHGVAIKVQKKLERKKSETKIKAELAHWLKNIVVPNVKKDVDRLAEELKDKVMKLPQNETIGKIAQRRARALAGEDTDIDFEQRELKDEVMNLSQNEPISKKAQNKPGAVADDDNDLDSKPPNQQATADQGWDHSDVARNHDKELKEFIETYVEHNYEVKDPIVEGALGNILMQEFIKLSPILRKEAYDDINSISFRWELEYIKEITDWLKNIPFYPLLNSVTDRVEFINDLARIIAELEQERAEGPSGPDFELLLYDNILQYMKQLPIPPQYMPQLMVSANQLRKRIAKRRPAPCCLLLDNDKAIECENDVVKLMEEFVTKLHGEEIGDDQLLREAYLARLFKEIRKIMNAGVFTNSQFMKKLEAVPFPSRESVKRFDIEMGYVAEIADWLQNFPLIPLKTVEDYETRIRMISELAEKLVEADVKRAANDPEVDADLDYDIAKWIVDLNLIPEKEIVVPVLISQLKRRMKKVQKFEGKSRSSLPVFFKDASANRTTSAQKEGEDYSKVGVGELMVKAIDNWCQDLPISNENKHLTEATKENVAIDIFKKVGQLSDDPHVANNDPLFEELLADDIDATLTNLSKNHPDIGDKKDELKVSILKDVMDAKKKIKRISAGDNYKSVLECTIDASFPNPVDQPPSYDPGFELYKRRMAMLWLLENYDHANNYGAVKYRIKLNQDIDKYADQAQKRNASPIDKNDIFNELFSSLYKQSPPSEHTIQEELEKIKTRCEVDEWCKELPLRQASGFDDLLQRDQVMEILAKKIFDIERSEDPDHVDEVMRKEIIKWIKKLPLLPGEDENLNMYADKLICMLKASAEQRGSKRVVNKTSKKRNSEIKVIHKEIKLGVQPRKLNTSQIAGPSGIKLPHHEKLVPARRKAADLISSTIDNWCRQLPLKADNPDEDQYVRNETAVKLHQILIDLLTDPTILNNEDLFEHYLNVGIQKVLSDLHTYSEDQWAKNARKGLLISELRTLRPLVKDDLDREGYKQNLKSVMSSFMEEAVKPNKITMNKGAQNQIIDDFVQYSYSKDDYADQQIFKDRIKNTMEGALKNNNENSNLDPKLLSNRLISEMKKVRPPKESALSDEVFEIQMKNEVSELLHQIPESSEKEQTKLTLAKKLTSIQRGGGGGGGDDDKIKAVIDKTIQKHGVDISPEEIDAFVNRLNRNGEKGTVRGASPKKADMSPRTMNQDPDPPAKRHVPMGPSSVSKATSNEPMNQTLPQISYSDSLESIEPYHNRSLPLPSKIPFPPRPFQPQTATRMYPNATPRLAAPIPQPFQVSKGTNPAQNASRNEQPSSLRPNIGPTDNQGPSNILSVPVEDRSGTNTPATAQISAQTQNDGRNWRNVENNVRNTRRDTAREDSSCECTTDLMKIDCPGPCRARKALYCDECEEEYDCEYDIPLCPCDLSRYYYY